MVPLPVCSRVHRLAWRYQDGRGARQPFLMNEWGIRRISCKKQTKGKRNLVEMIWWQG